MPTLNWPWWLLVLILGVEGWPVALGGALGLVALAVLARGWIRRLALVTAVPCLSVTAVAGWWGLEARQRDREAVAFEARRHQILDSDRVVDGLSLPAGTTIEWLDVDHHRLESASPLAPLMLFGLRVSWIQLADDGEDWDLQLPEPELVEGWACAETPVRVSRTGQLRSCRLAAGRNWQGWPIPAGSLLDLATAETIGLALPTGATMSAPEIGHGITDTGTFTINADGSLDRFYFEPDDPLRVAGRRLWNTVRWTYDLATYGQGRRRRAIAVRGSLMSAGGEPGGDVVIRLADGHVSAAE